MFSRRPLLKLICRRRFSSRQSAGEKTALYDFHVENGGKMVNFGGFLLPVQYSDLGIAASHVHTRKEASIFDVSHMLQTEVKGKGCLDYFESICTADLRNLPENSSVLTVFTNDKGGILDDLIVTKINDEHLYVVSNAAMKLQDQKIMSEALKDYRKKTNAEMDIRFFEPKERGLIALQGPKAAGALQKVTDVDVSKLYFMTTSVGRVGNAENCRITRCGYTGEDGFEISIPAERQVEVTRVLLEQEDVKLAGLGARDSLRLEAGLCLYGSDIDQTTTPVEAGLTWLVAKARRQTGNFPGASRILDQIRDGCARKRVGVVSSTGPPARHGTKIMDQEHREIGEVTSGCPAPSLGKNISMGYVPNEHSKAGTKVLLKIRDKAYIGDVTRMPFVPSRYYVKPKGGK
ncbi:aminomethyltransferase, mitochondrial [Coccinella septempunctata]|uniref:aminomethyltransferase, mitochondrial n=1 Tax=Coccinella septempunctata TaxID=41139 RepID=UPI001D08B5F5|nr:aminomethyltransferase, mitochondrial [Coccinella septempunctata]